MFPFLIALPIPKIFILDASSNYLMNIPKFAGILMSRRAKCATSESEPYTVIIGRSIRPSKKAAAIKPIMKIAFIKPPIKLLQPSSFYTYSELI